MRSSLLATGWLHVFALETDKQRPLMGKQGNQQGGTGRRKGQDRREDEKLKGVEKSVKGNTVA